MAGENGVAADGQPARPNKRCWDSIGGYEAELNAHVEKERAAVLFASKVGELLYERGIELVLFRKHLVDITTSEVLRLHEYAEKVVEKEIDIFTTSALAKALCEIDLVPSKLDIGKIAHEWLAQTDSGKSMPEFLRDTLTDLAPGKQGRTPAPRDVVLFGFGRIGRLAARLLILGAGKGQQLRLRAVVTRDNKPQDILKRAALFSNDSTHGAFKGSVECNVEEQVLVINGQIVKFISAKSPEDIDYTKFGIKDALVIDNTGAFTDKDSLSRHLKSGGVDKVILTAPGKGVPNIVYGINQDVIDLQNDKIVSAASCTTNAVSPILKVIEDTFGVRKGHVETIHSYTNDQNLLDNFHKKARRGRSAAVNMVITATGAATAVPKIIPSLKGKLTANAVRVPTPNASLAILNLELNAPATLDAINDSIRVASISGDLVNQIHYSIDEELVSNDVVGNDCCSVYDTHASIGRQDGSSCILYTWYDNEFGYTKQVIRLAKFVSGVRRMVYY